MPGWEEDHRDIWVEINRGKSRQDVTDNEIKHIHGDLDELKESLGSANAKLDRLVAAVNMGQGAWIAAAKIGGVLVMAAGAAAWAFDHLRAALK